MKNSAWSDEVQDRDEQYRLKRQALLRTAARAFNQHGYHKTSLNDLAKQLNVTKPTLYYYVKSKEDILIACQRIAIDQMRDAITEAHEGKRAARARLREFICRYAEMIADDFGRCLALSGMNDLSAEAREEMRCGRRDIDIAMRTLVEQGIADQSIAPCDATQTANALFGAINWMAHWYREDGPSSPAEIADRMFDVFERGMQSRDET
jgi:AcrR family transcriptional regulator